MLQLIPSTTPLRTFEDQLDTIRAVAVFPDRRRMITGSKDKTHRIWDLETGVVLKKMEGHSREVWALGVSRDGQIIASGDRGGELIAWHGETGGDENDSTIREWDPSNWQQVGHPWEGHTDDINTIAIDLTGTLVASASYEMHVRLWRLTDRQNIAIFEHSSSVYTVTFSVDGRHILSGGDDHKISEWEVPKGVYAKASFYS
ncbi:hypothetical protein CY34DRAFT_19783 [Suillus luteus UH-Slu-Lm8-n1]|uniref:WD40 repeat-like protein n=1 Tax=Suillus luteus UH-Slu-Lm8-n1 TaxID=930992 RepID=A0A0C9Z296_9AGAM|nr:hypothetical protein CY34DRAFT_19783 [Suillus luteus UH-Slu-Lm8-n1]